MKFKLYREYGALNSPAIFDAFEQGIKKLGFEISNDADSIPVIWSVLWHGRMKPNQQVYYNSVTKKIPVIIIEVGNFFRGKTWRISINNVNRDGYFGDGPVDKDRPSKLGIKLNPINFNRRSEILIACQHDKSLQWPLNFSIESWVNSIIANISTESDRKIIVRPHPRCPLNLTHKRIIIDRPKKIPNSYDDYNFDHNYHAVINYNTGPAIQAAIRGTPVICEPSGLAFPVSDTIKNIENIELKDRDDWLIDLSHKEWTVDEIANGIPQERILCYFDQKKS